MVKVSCHKCIVSFYRSVNKLLTAAYSQPISLSTVTSRSLTYFYLFTFMTGEESSLRFYTLLSHVGIALICLHYFGASLTMTYLDPIMSQWLQDTVSIHV